MVWIDSNNNGRVDGGETGLAGVAVRLYDASENLIASTTTDANGEYVFVGLTAGDYRIEITTPSGFTGSTGTNGSETGPAEPAPSANDDANNNDDGSSNSASTISSSFIAIDGTEPTDDGTLTSLTDATPNAQSNYTVDFGVVRPAAIGDRVWFDTNNNGQQDVGETGVEGITVQLFDASGALVATTTTNASGSYIFDRLTPGEYSITFDRTTLPTGWKLTSANTGSDFTDSDADPVTGHTSTYVLAAGDRNLTVDAGLVSPKASLGDTVWFDLNNNGTQDTNETGVAGVKVNLLDANGTVISTQITDANGKYLFDNLAPGTYSVEFVASSLPNGYSFTKANQGADATDSDADGTTGRTGTYTLVAGQHDPTVDAGIVSLKSSLGDTVWFDQNGNGVQDANEVGVPNVIVELRDATGKVLDSQKTDANGKYLFTNLDPGTYNVRFDPASLPSGYGFTSANGTDDTTNSDANTVTGVTRTYDLGRGVLLPTVDAGIVRITIPQSPVIIVPAPTVPTVATVATVATVPSVAPVATTPTIPSSPNSIAPASTTATIVAPSTGGTPLRAPSIRQVVWEDTNRNGKLDPEERPISGATVTLTLADGTTVKTTTDSNGRYEFFDLPKGEYTVEVLATDSPTNGPIRRKIAVKGVTLESTEQGDFGFTAATAVSQPNDSIAFTGSMSDRLALVGMGMILGGLILATTPRRRKQKAQFTA